MGSPAYGDWSPRAGGAATSPDTAGDLLVRNAPPTTAIPERPISRRGRSADALDDDLDNDPRLAGRAGRPPATRSPGTGPVGGRAAMRAERQAADMARRKVAKRSGAPEPVALLDPEEAPRKPRRALKALVAMAVVGLGVLGVYTVISPKTEEVGTQTPFVASSPTVAAPSEPLPTLPSEVITLEPTPAAAPVRVPVTVLNATSVTGLAAKISGTIVGGGWESPGVGAYLGNDVPATTVFFTEGDETQRQAALQLVEMYPQITGPAPRFFELPPDVPAPGLVVVAAGEWVP
ncbi:MAG: LytR C-terminal domain-containing protein [Blastococcus sp.]